MTRRDVDAELRTVLERRERALDLLVRCLIDVDTLTNRVDVLLDRRTEQKTQA